MTSWVIGGFDVGLMLLAVAVILISYVLSRTTYAILRYVLDDRLQNLRDSKLIARLVEYAILGVGFYFGLIYFLTPLGLGIPELAASLGIIGVAVAFASQQVVQNVIAGVLIALERTIQLEEWVEIGDTGLCKVKDINLTNTILRSVEGRVFIVPNANVLSTKVINYTRSGIVEVTLKLEVPIGADYARVKALILGLVEKNRYILPVLPLDEDSKVRHLLQLPRVRRLLELTGDNSQFQPQVLITSITAEKVQLDVHIWIREFEKRDLIVSQVMEELLEGLKELRLPSSEVLEQEHDPRASTETLVEPDRTLRSES